MGELDFMSATLTFQVFYQERWQRTGDLAGPLIVGRQDESDKLFQERSQPKDPGIPEIPIAPFSENHIHRRHVRLEPLENNRVRISNLGRNDVLVRGRSPLAFNQFAECPVPLVFALGRNGQLRVEIDRDVEDESEIHAMPNVAAPPLETFFHVAKDPAAEPFSQPVATSVVTWLRMIIDVLQSAVGALDFFERAAHGVLKLVRLDCVSVLLWDDGEWKLEAQAQSEAAANRPWQPSRRILEQVRSERRTFWQLPIAGREAFSLQGVHAILVSPIVDREGAVIGVLYGDRQSKLQPLGQVITEAEAMLMETLACGLAAGLSRMKLERAAAEAKVRFEQFFTPQLAQQLVQDDKLLDGKEADVTLLFCDICGFSRISERLGPADTMKWIGDVLEVLSSCVADEMGVLVDYIGDELLAMWGAPEKVPDHAERACRAALAMRSALPELSRRWKPVIGEETRIGIGINTGPAQVGNTGSKRKFKYGPLGKTVNLASRVQGATRHLNTTALITASTQSKLNAPFFTRRLCSVIVVNMEQPVMLYELAQGIEPGWDALRTQYEQALLLFEQQEFGKSVQILGNIQASYAEDGPTLLLLSRAVEAKRDEAETHHPHWKLPGK